LAAVSALQLRGKKQTLMNITYAVHLPFLTQVRPSSKPRFEQPAATLQAQCRQECGLGAWMAARVSGALSTAQL